MTIFLLIAISILGGGLIVTYLLKRRIEKTVDAARQEALNAKQQRDADIAHARADANAAISNAQAAYEQKVGELDAEAERIRSHYEIETRKIADEADARLAELEPLRGYAALQDAEKEVQKVLAEAVADATALREEAKKLLDQTHEAAAGERIQAKQRVREMADQAD